jgi:hypothetical protein
MVAKGVIGVFVERDVAVKIKGWIGKEGAAVVVGTVGVSLHVEIQVG